MIATGEASRPMWLRGGPWSICFFCLKILSGGPGAKPTGWSPQRKRGEIRLQVFVLHHAKDMIATIDANDFTRR